MLTRLEFIGRGLHNALISLEPRGGNRTPNADYKSQYINKSRQTTTIHTKAYARQFAVVGCQCLPFLTGECPASVPRSRGSVKPSTFRGAQLPGIFKRGSGSVERAVVGRAERCREVVRAAARLHALRQPGGDMAVEGAGLVPGGEEEGKMRIEQEIR